jgi:hypothetical protein
MQRIRSSMDVNLALAALLAVIVVGVLAAMTRIDR